MSWFHSSASAAGCSASGRSGRLNSVEQQQAVENQRLVVVQARSKVRLLERLRENRKAEWQLEQDRELELLAQESFGARWVRNMQRSERAAN